MKKIGIAAVGCGNRSNEYLSLLMKHHQESFEIKALADPEEARRNIIASYQREGDVRHFESADDFFKQDKMADAVIIATQDDYHFNPAMKALEKGYDLILEKPVSNRLEETFILERKAEELKRKVIICHVLRYTPFYGKIKELLDDGKIGELISIDAVEGVNPWHQAHSFVRGNWADTKKSSPMILAKSCHDMDVFSWLTGEACLEVSSFGELSFFREEKAPQGAPERCTDGCPVAGECIYNALFYRDKYRNPWLAQLLDNEKNAGETGGASDEEIMAFLKTSDWGKCVYHSGNDAVDHQVVSLKFARGITGSFTMTAFDTGRSITVFGTKGTLKGGDFIKKATGYDLIFTDHGSGEMQRWNLEYDAEGYESHGGGDFGFVSTWKKQLTTGNPEDLHSSIHKSVESHVMAWAAEESRITGKSVNLKEYRNQFDT